MSTRSFSRSSSFGKSSSRRRSSGGSGSRFAGGRPSISRKSRFCDQRINPDRFVCKAEPIVSAKPYESKNSFADFAIDQKLKENIKVKGYVTPTPIQDESIPAVLEGLDVVGIANTGTGK